jgi:hypothetical protein
MNTENKDWSSNTASHRTVGPSAYTDVNRQQHDYYATEPKALELLLEVETFSDKIWECSCGEGHLSRVLTSAGKDTLSSDLIDRGYGQVQDFLCMSNVGPGDRDIITNPPFKFTNEFLVKAMSILDEGRKIAFFLPIRYVEGKARRLLFQRFPPKTVYVSSGRLICAINGDFETITGSATAYAWFIWEKGYQGTTELKWFN